MKRTSTYVVLLAFVATIVNAQVDLPPNAEAGKCYAKCLKPLQFMSKSEQFVAKEAATMITVTPATIGTEEISYLKREASQKYSISSPVFRTATEQIMIQDESKRFELVPGSGSYKSVSERYMSSPEFKTYRIEGCNEGVAGNGRTLNANELNQPCFKTVSEQRLAKESYSRIEVVPAEFKTVTEQVLVKEASKRYEVVPAIYKKVSKQVVVSPQYTVLRADNNVKFKTITERVMVRPSYVRYEITPAQFKTEKKSYLAREAAPAVGGNKVPKFRTVTEQVMIKPASKVYQEIPATYKTVSETVVVKDPITSLSVIPATYETVTERVKIRDSYSKYEKGKVDPTCLSANPEDCRIICLVEVPAEYKTITRQVVKTPARVIESVTPSQTSKVTKTVIDRAASVREIEVPAEYATISRKVFDGYVDTNEKLSGAEAFNGGVVREEYASYTFTTVIQDAQVREVVVPAEFKNISRQMVDSGAKVVEETVPAKYETVSVNVVDQPASVKEIDVPAEYITRTFQEMVRPASTREVSVPAEYVTDSRLVCGDNNKGNEDGSNASVSNLNGCGAKVSVSTSPAEYASYSRYVIDAQPQTREITVPAEYRTITKQVLDKPAAAVAESISAEYASITKTVVKTPATSREISGEPEMLTYSLASLSGAAAYNDWVEVLCESKMTTERIRGIQIALRNAGYDPGPIDNIFGAQTKTALLQYQKDKNLPQGNLNIETLTSLGVNY